MRFYALILFLFSSYAFTQDFERYDIEYKDNFMTSDQYQIYYLGEKKNISKQTLIKKPTFDINFIISSDQDQIDETVISLTILFDDSDCKSIKCFTEQKDIINLIKKSDPKSYEKLDEKIKKVVSNNKSYNISVLKMNIKSAELHPQTPIFSEGVISEFSNEEDVFFEESLFGILSPNAVVNKFELEYIPSEEDLFQKEQQIAELPSNYEYLNVPMGCNSFYDLVVFGLASDKEIYYDTDEELVLIILEKHKRYYKEYPQAVAVSYCLSKKVKNIAENISEKLKERLNENYGNINCSEFF